MKIKKRVIALIAAMALGVSGVNVLPAPALAQETKTQEESFLHGYINAEKEATKKEYFHVDEDNTIVKITLSTTAEEVSGLLKLTYKKENEEEAISNEIPLQTKKSEQPDPAGSGKALNYCTVYKKLFAGDYNVSITFDKATTFDLYLTDCVCILENDVDVVEGFSTKAEIVKSDYANIELLSTDESVATVDNEGNVTGVKEGTAKVTIVGKDESGTVLFTIPNQCKIKVKKNFYKSYLLTISKAKKIKGTVVLNVYTMKYDSKGNLVLKFTIANKYKKTIKRINNVKVKVVDENGKTVGKYSGSFKRSVKSGSTRNVNITVKKKDLKIKSKVDLTKCNVIYLNDSKDKLTANT